MREACELQDSAHGEVISAISRLWFLMISHSRLSDANSTSRMDQIPHTQVVSDRGYSLIRSLRCRIARCGLFNHKQSLSQTHNQDIRLMHYPNRWDRTPFRSSRLRDSFKSRIVTIKDGQPKAITEGQGSTRNIPFSLALNACLERTINTSP